MPEESTPLTEIDKASEEAKPVSEAPDKPAEGPAATSQPADDNPVDPEIESKESVK
jgi:hypothetical protein